ncbi:MAG TPA: hypothetical protein VFZ73_18605 [Gemmatimonadaceae bacterium]
MKTPTSKPLPNAASIGRRVVWLLFLAALPMAMPSPAGAQSRPDFSGEWARVDSTAEQRSVAAVGDAAFRTGSMGSGWGSPLMLRQQGNELVVEYPHFATYDLQPRLRFTYRLDGSDSRNAIMIGHAETVLRSRAQVRDSTLVITTTYQPVDGVSGTIEVRQVLSLESPATLLIETTRTSGGSSTPPTRTVYRRN